MKIKKDPSQTATKTPKPILAVELPAETVKCVFHLKEPIAKLIAEYAEFLSSHHKKKIPGENVVENLATQLGKDKLFNEWKKAKANGLQ